MGETASSRGFPSLATVVDLLRLRLERNLEGFEGLDSVLGVGRPSGPRDVWLPLPFMRKKFLSFVEVGVEVPEPSEFAGFLEKDRLEKLRFSVAMLQGAN